MHELQHGNHPVGLSMGSHLRLITMLTLVNRAREYSGRNNTIMIGERCVTSGAGIWPGVNSNRNENDQVTDCSHASRLNDSYAGFSSRHEGGANFLLCDGAVRFVADDIDSRPGPAEGDAIGLYQRLADRHDGQPSQF